MVCYRPTTIQPNAQTRIGPAIQTRPMDLLIANDCTDYSVAVTADAVTSTAHIHSSLLRYRLSPTQKVVHNPTLFCNYCHEDTHHYLHCLCNPFIHLSHQPHLHRRHLVYQTTRARLRHTSLAHHSFLTQFQ